MIEPSAIPHMESILRDFGLTPKELDTIFSATKVDGRGGGSKKICNKIKRDQ